jgi:Regulator of chromosome condensation (RCC1) repeat
VRSDGTAWAWGSNFHGELGDGTTDARFAPVQVTGLTGVTQVAGGCDHSLALRSDGTVWAWGGNTVGQLGRGTITGGEVTAAPVSGLAGVTKIAAGCEFSLALRSDGTVWAWGGNDNGQLGDGTLTGHATPVRVTQIGAVHIAGAAVGYKSAAILGTDGSVWAWGNDTRGQLGNAPAATPVTRPVNTIRADSGITQVAAGGGDMVALKSDGTVLAWGDNTDGELGIGTKTPVTGPVQVTGLTGAAQVAAGAEAGFAVHVVPLTAVPDLTGDTHARAGQVLQAAGLVLGAVTTVTDKYCNHLGVMSQDRPPGPPSGPAPRSRSPSARLLRPGARERQPAPQRPARGDARSHDLPLSPATFRGMRLMHVRSGQRACCWRPPPPHAVVRAVSAPRQVRFRLPPNAQGGPVPMTAPQEAVT